jgi:hypothetical protein
MFRLMGYKGIFGHFLFVLAVLKCHWFVSGTTSWTQQQKLVLDDGAAHDNFGFSVALDGDTAVIGARWHDNNGLNSGSVYVYVRSDTAWTQQQRLVASDVAVVGDEFGHSVALDGNTAVVGAVADDDNDPPYSSNMGSVYVFVRSGTTWTQQQRLLGYDRGDDYFGYSIALDGDTVVIGARWDNDNGSKSGSLRVCSFGHNMDATTETHSRRWGCG